MCIGIICSINYDNSFMRSSTMPANDNELILSIERNKDTDFIMIIVGIEMLLSRYGLWHAQKSTIEIIEWVEIIIPTRRQAQYVKTQHFIYPYKGLSLYLQLIFHFSNYSFHDFLLRFHFSIFFLWLSCRRDIFY